MAKLLDENGLEIVKNWISDNFLKLQGGKLVYDKNTNIANTPRIFFLGGVDGKSPQIDIYGDTPSGFHTRIYHDGFELFTSKVIGSANFSFGGFQIYYNATSALSHETKLVINGYKLDVDKAIELGVLVPND